MISRAPVALFVHARVDHTTKVINALKLNELADLTELYIFSDGARTDEDEKIKVASIRTLISNIEGFKKVEVVERQKNYGLKKNIVDGISYVLAKHENVIVLEDDIVTKPTFLINMNTYLNKYKQCDDIWHISAWNIGVDGDYDCFKSHFMSCWGWATWSDRWQKLELDPLVIIKQMTINDRYKFNLNGSFPFFSHIVANLIKKRNTWAIFWAATIFINGGKTITPTISEVRNIGMDGSGTHNAVVFQQDIFENKTRNYSAEESIRVQNSLSKIFKGKLSKFGKLKMNFFLLFPTFLYVFIAKFIK
jgi:hypothetical protein